MKDAPVLIEIEKLKPHPANPRVIEREDVIAAIEQQIREVGFDPSHAILVRPVEDGYQIISGHNRTAAARRAGLKQVPAWVRDMEDEEAFMQLVLANAQGELSPLEHGIHALEATEKGKHGGKSVAAYAREVGRPQQRVNEQVQAARVAGSYRVSGNFAALADRTYHLIEIHAAPANCWSALVSRLVDCKWTIEEARAMVHVINTAKAPRGYEEIFTLAEIQERLARGDDDVNEAIRHSIRVIERAYADLRDGQYDSDKYIDVVDQHIKEHGAWDSKAIANLANELVRAQRNDRREAEAKAAKLKRPIVLTEWAAMTAGERQAALAVRNDKAKLTRQDKNSAIDWARWSWNPVTGCQHNCPYCYARDIAERFYPQKFVPSIVPDALAAPLNTAPPKEAGADVGYKNIFTCSMADLFGGWVPREWIEAVLAVAREAKQWNFLMLTKFPQRLAEFEFPENVWLGTTVDCQARVANAERAMAKVKAAVKWLSIEPMIEPITIDFTIFQWIVLGGASASSQTPEWKPPRRWVMDMTCQAMDGGCSVYHKANLNFDPVRQYPGADGSAEPETAPEQFLYLK